MGQTTINIKNVGRPAPRWFRKTKKAISILTDTAIVMLLAMGHKDNSVLMLWCRVGIGGLLTAFEEILANGEEYTKTENQQP